VRCLRRLHNKELHNLYASSNITGMIMLKRMRWVGHVACMEALLNSYKILVIKAERKRFLRRPRYCWEDNTRMDCREMGWEDVDWFHLAENRDHWQTLVNPVINLQTS